MLNSNEGIRKVYILVLIQEHINLPQSIWTLPVQNWHCKWTFCGRIDFEQLLQYRVSMDIVLAKKSAWWKWLLWKRYSLP